MGLHAGGAARRTGRRRAAIVGQRGQARHICEDIVAVCAVDLCRIVAEQAVAGIQGHAVDRRVEVAVWATVGGQEGASKRQGGDAGKMVLTDFDAARTRYRLIGRYGAVGQGYGEVVA